MTDLVRAKRGRLAERLADLAPGVIAVSGGVDSRLLAHMAWGLGLDFLAVHFTGPHIGEAEEKSAREWLAAQGRPWKLVEADPLRDARVATNDPKRCYYCKRRLFTSILAIADGRPVLDGTHASDSTGYRPGLAALKELGVVSPLAEAGLRKTEIRVLARDTGMTWPDQPSRPCLLTRFAYGLPADRETLGKLGAAEDALAGLGLTDFRLRIVKPGAYVLQLAESERARWLEVEDEIYSLPELVPFHPLTIVVTERVSGFFDRDRRDPTAS